MTKTKPRRKRKRRGNVDVRLRRLDRRAMAGDQDAAAQLYVAMWRAPRPGDQEWARKSTWLVDQAGHLVDPGHADFKAYRDELRCRAAGMGKTWDEPGRESWIRSEGPHEALDQEVYEWLQASVGGDDHWMYQEGWGDHRYVTNWVSLPLYAMVSVTEGDLGITIYKSPGDFLEGFRSAVKFYSGNPGRNPRIRGRAYGDMTAKAKKFIKAEVRRQIHKGKGQDQAVAIAYHVASAKGYHVPVAPVQENPWLALQGNPR